VLLGNIRTEFDKHGTLIKVIKIIKLSLKLFKGQQWKYERPSVT